MSAAVSEGPASRATLHMIARLHYEGDVPQVEIARRLGLSPATISRLLKRAREEGIVRIEVRDLVPSDQLGHELAQRLGLKLVSLNEGTPPNAVAGLVAPLSEILKARLHQGSILAIGWGRAVREVIRTGLPRIPGVVTLPAMGGMQEAAPHFQINEFVRLAAEQLGGTPRFIHAPAVMSSAARDAVLSDPTIGTTVALWDRIDVAIVGIGLPHAVDPTYAASATADERAMHNVAGDVLRHYFDVEGKLLDWGGTERLIAVSPEQLRATPLVIGVAISAEKARAIIGAARAGLINALVTDAPTAQAILALL